jgi:hypothetical protein
LSYSFGIVLSLFDGDHVVGIPARRTVMVKIQQIIVSDVGSKTPSVEITISNNEDIEKASVYLVASVKIHRKGKSFENVQLDALDQLRGLIEQAADQVDTTFGGTA